MKGGGAVVGSLCSVGSTLSPTSAPTDEVDEGTLVSDDTEGICLGGSSATTLDLSIGAMLGNTKL